MTEVLVIAVGNAWRGDDGLGPELAARLRRLALRGVHVVDAPGDPGLIDAWSPDDHVILLDAVSSGAPGGTIISRDAVGAPLPRAWFRASSHNIGVADAVELARALGRLPRTLVFIGIEAASLSAGVGLSPAVRQALSPALALVRAELRQIRRRARRRRLAPPPAPARQSPAPRRA